MNRRYFFTFQTSDQQALDEEPRDVGRRALFKKHRAILAILKSRAMQTRASSIGLQILSSRDPSFSKGELDDEADMQSGLTGAFFSHDYFVDFMLAHCRKAAWAFNATKIKHN